ncbi:MAG TPA: hypothetical protein VEU47_04080 [Candidatus Cybelea sp.]|nr:hypothetical protein [Candidatus Cybelea sp.]
MTRHSLRVALGAALVTAALAACHTDLPPPPVYPEITFANEPKIRLDVAAIQVDDQYFPPLKPPNVDHEFPVRIAAVAERWAQDRLQAVGTRGTARVVIKDASAVATNLKKSSGLSSVFTNEQSVRYDTQVSMLVEILDQRGGQLAAATASAARTRSVPEDITLNQRDKVWFEMTEQLMRDEDAALTKNVLTYMRSYIR